MDLLRQFFHTIYNVHELINLLVQRYGPYALFVVAFIIFSETGLMVGFFLPGDSLLVTAGIFAAAGLLNIYVLVPLLMCAAILGNSTGYFIGSRAGKALYNRRDSFFFKREHLVKTHEFYERHGGKTIILAQFMPIARTFAPVVAGAAGMPYRRFAGFNVIGAVCWISSMTLLGFFLGQAVPNVEKHIDVVVVIVVFLSLLPGIISLLRARLRKRAAARQLNGR